MRSNAFNLSWMDLRRCLPLSDKLWSPLRCVQPPSWTRDKAFPDVHSHRAPALVRSRRSCVDCPSAPPLEVEIDIGCSNCRLTGAYEAQHTHVLKRFFEIFNIYLYDPSIGTKCSKILKYRWCRVMQSLGEKWDVLFKINMTDSYWTWIFLCSKIISKNNFSKDKIPNP